MDCTTGYSCLIAQAGFGWIPPEDRPAIPSPGLGKIAVSRELLAVSRTETLDARLNSDLPASTRCSLKRK
jgi:hypothetical protein